jgi:hypothetical protein
VDARKPAGNPAGRLYFAVEAIHAIDDERNRLPLASTVGLLPDSAR